ncbi:MAG TPA: class I SAM-dependent methyltransferase [Acidobacteriaceae bacterium]|nr:class I SAM-dependent methyltransferase [Acidobacteriaceae bacterium]
MTDLPTICDAAADQQFQSAIREQYPESYSFEARYVEHEMAHIGLLFAAGLCPVQGKRVLEFGCNIGATAIVLAHYGARVTAVDIDPCSLAMARLNIQRYGSRGIRLQQIEEGERLPFADRSFDVITCNSVLEYVRPDLLPGVQRELNRVLIPGGLLLVFGTSNRLSPIEAHSGDWFSNYVPTRFDRLAGRQLSRGVSPWKLRRGFGRGYQDLFCGPRGTQRYIELKRSMGLNGWKFRLLRTLGVAFAISPVSVPLLLPFATVLLRKPAEDTV